MRDLYDQQEGPPLLRHEKKWQAAYDKAGDVLEESDLIDEVRQEKEDTLPNPLQIELGAGKILVSKFEDTDGAAGVMFACGHGQFPIGTPFGNMKGRHIPQKGEVYIRCTNLASLEILKQCVLEAEQTLKESDHES